MKNNFVLNFKRPEYVPYPELFISSLAWKAASLPAWSGVNNGKPIGLVYERDGLASQKIELKRTNPTFRPGQLELWHAAIDRSFDSESAQAVGDALVAGLKGVSSLRMKSQSATPITKHAALLQNTYGVFNKKGPPDIGAILETMFLMGRNSASSKTASELWLSAMECRNRIDPLLRGLDEAIRDGILPDAGADIFTAKPSLDESQLSFGFSNHTPYSWLNKQWSAVTSNAWVEALPPRRWVDWATTVLCTGFAMCLLWEMRWYEELAAAILSSDDQDQIEIVNAVRFGAPLLEWRDANEGETLRDIAEPVRAVIAHGVAIRTVLNDDKLVEYNATSFSEQVRELRKNQDLIDKLKQATRSSFNNSANSMWESIKYALIVRSADGELSDHYGVIKTRARFSVVEPASEWITCMASLSCPGPKSTGTLGDLSKSLDELGLRPSSKLLLSNLEKAGLARGAADADQAVEIESAF